MLWYNNPELIEAIRDGRGLTTVDENNRLMRLARADETIA
jgi:hypothetical protein